MNKFYISILLLPVVCIGLAYSNEENIDCPYSISVAQGCVKQCVDSGPADHVAANGTVIHTYDNKLLKCISTSTQFSQQLGQCCEMSTDCQDNVNATNTCLNGSLKPVKDKLIDYFSCVSDNFNSEIDAIACNPKFCVGLLTGGHKMGFDNDFDVGDQG